MIKKLSARVQNVISERPTRLVVDGVNRLAMSLSVVQICDLFLNSVYGICHYDSRDVWLEQGKSISSEIGVDNWLNFQKLFDKRWAAKKKFGYVPETLDHPFYDAIAKAPLSGWVHSLKRSLILDAAILAHAVYRDRNMTGPILEIGGHIGYHGAWLASVTGTSVVSVEVSEAAVQAARRLAPSEHVEYIPVRWNQYLQSTCTSFQFVVAFDSVDSNEDKFLRAVKPALAPDGIVLMTLSGNNIDDVIIKAQSLGFQAVMFNQIGGYCLPEEGGSPYEARIAVLFSENGVEVGDWSPMEKWDSFSKYANSGLPLAEQTQAFFLAQEIETLISDINREG